jgi:hypothetical protein
MLEPLELQVHVKEDELSTSTTGLGTEAFARLGNAAPTAGGPVGTFFAASHRIYPPSPLNALDVVIRNHPHTLLIRFSNTRSSRLVPGLGIVRVSVLGPCTYLLSLPWPSQVAWLNLGSFRGSIPRRIITLRAKHV